MRFESYLTSVKKSIPLDYPWYPYRTLTNFAHLKRLLRGENRLLLRLTGGQPVLDIGSADGDMSFFLESLGCTVHAIDHPAPNHNAMTGIRALHERLGSRVRIHEIDLDAQFEPPISGCGLAFLLGAVYHLKNPFYALERLSKAAQYCLVSTRIAKVFPPLDSAVDGVPAAYLLDSGELNADNSNFWIFSDAGFRRLLKRTNWQALDYLVLPTRKPSDPISIDRDQRAFCLARSTYALANFELERGWHAPEGNGWRWTEKEFSISSTIGGEPRPASFRLRIFVAPALLEGGRTLTLSAAADGAPFPSETYRTPGDYTYVRFVPAKSWVTGKVRLDFRLDHALPADASDPRERGVVVNGFEID